MRVLLIDSDETSRTLLSARLTEALHQTGIRKGELLEGDIDSLRTLVAEEPPQAIFLGPSCYTRLQENIDSVRLVFPNALLSLVLNNDIYVGEAVELRRLLMIRIIPLADIAQMAQFILDCAGKDNSNREKACGIVAVAQFKGGVGATSLANGLACCWARHGLDVGLVDLDDVNPQITEWAKTPTAKRQAVTSLLKNVDQIKTRYKEIIHSLAGFDGKLAVIPQPEFYGESFHFKADVLEEAASSADFIAALFPELQSEFDIVVVDLGRSWGVSTLAALPYCQHVITVVDDQLVSMEQTLRNFNRIYRESDDTMEFDLSKWNFVLNTYSGVDLSAQQFIDAVAALNIFPRLHEVFTVPLSPSAKNWSCSSESFYDLADHTCQRHLSELAFGLIPFQFENQERFTEMLRSFSRFLGFAV